MSTKQEREQESCECRNTLIGEQVIHTLGQPDGLQGVQVRPLWEDHYRVNVLVVADDDRNLGLGGGPGGDGRGEGFRRAVLRLPPGFRSLAATPWSGKASSARIDSHPGEGVGRVCETP